MQPIPRSANPTDVVNEFGVEITTARKNQLNVLSPDWFTKAETSLARAFITQNPYEKAKMQEMANDALFYAQRLVQMNKQSQKIRTMESEEIARWIEDMLHQTTAKLSAPDMRNEPFETQVENMVESVAALQADHNFVIRQSKSQEVDISNLEKRMAVLEGETQEERMAKERLTAEKEFNQKFSQIQSYFDSGEAEVYKQGSQLVIRLKAIQFPVGKDIIMPKNYELLSIVQNPFAPSANRTS